MKKFKAHILIVDDDDRIRELVKQYLNDNDYLVTTANNIVLTYSPDKTNILQRTSSIFIKFTPTNIHELVE